MEVKVAMEVYFVYSFCTLSATKFTELNAIFMFQKEAEL
jgi:hypothetical protein